MPPDRYPTATRIHLNTGTPTARAVPAKILADAVAYLGDLAEHLQHLHMAKPRSDVLRIAARLNAGNSMVVTSRFDLAVVSFVEHVAALLVEGEPIPTNRLNGLTDTLRDAADNIEQMLEEYEEAQP